MKKIKKNESGRSMVEMLGVLAIIGVLSVGGIAGYKMAMEQIEINNIYNFFGELELAIQHLNQTAVHEDEFLYMSGEEITEVEAQQHNKDLLCASSLISKGCKEDKGKRFFVLGKYKYSLLFNDNTNRMWMMVSFPDINGCKMLFQGLSMYSNKDIEVQVGSYGSDFIGKYSPQDFSAWKTACEKINGTTNMYITFYNYL